MLRLFSRCTALCAIGIFIVEELTHNKGHSRLHVYTSLLLTSVMVCMLGIKFQQCSHVRVPLFFFSSFFSFLFSFHLPSISPYLYPSRPLFYPLSHSFPFTLHTSNSHFHCHSFLFALPLSQLPSVPFFHPPTRPSLSPFTFLFPSLSPSSFHTHSVPHPRPSAPFMPSLRPSILPSPFLPLHVRASLY